MPDVDYAQLAGALIDRMGGQAKPEPVGFGGDGVMRTVTRAVGSTPTASYGHGPGGIFSSPAMDRQVFSALILPFQGIAGRIPARPSNLVNPLYSIMTGVTATTGNEPNGPCDDFPVSGLMKLCSQTSYFGRQGRQTPIFELDRMGLLNSRGEHVDLQLLGNARDASAKVGPLAPTLPGNAGNPLQTEVAKAMFELGTAWSRDFAYETYTGNPVNNSFGGGRKYYRGLDLLINTGYRDAETGTVCPAADSIVEAFGNLDVSTNGAALVRRMTSIYRRLRYIAAHTNLLPVKWVIAMPWQAFYEITEIWPCAYMTYRCQNAGTFSASQPQVTDSVALLNMRDAMRGDLETMTGQYLLMDGEKVEVVIDEGITVTEVAGQSFRTPIYFVPLDVLGGVNVTYWEYVNYDMPNGAMDAAAVFAPPGMFFTSDGGRFLWHREPPANYCVRLKAKTEPRLILRTPFLAARLTGVQYTPLAAVRGWDPTSGNQNNSFYVDGGGTNRNASDFGVGSFYTPT